MRVTAAEPGPEIDAERCAGPGDAGPGARRRGGDRAARRAAGRRVEGPAIVELPESTLVVPPGWRGEVRGTRAVRLWMPVTLRVLSGALRAACEEMGAVLVQAAHSANIKERRDCSCALFDADGAMVMQAEHIPVHLGAMPAAVAAVADAREDRRRPRPWILNDPYAGGTHLPDITVVTPVGGPRLRRHPRPPRRRRRPDPGLHARRLARRSTTRAS